MLRVEDILSYSAKNPLLFNQFVFLFLFTIMFAGFTLLHKQVRARNFYLLLFSLSEKGLQNSIDKMCKFYYSLGLEISLKKTKVIVFNKSGKLLKGYKFMCNGSVLEVTKEYQYLGIKFTPSGSMNVDVD